MTEPVAAMTTVRPPERTVRGLPMPPPPAERFLRLRRDPGTLLVWLGIIGAMVASATFFAQVPMVMVGVIAASAIGAFKLAGVRNKRFNNKNEEALKLLNAGDVAEAEAIYLELARKHRGNLGIIAAHNVAVCKMRRGDSIGGLAILCDLEAKRALNATLAHLKTSVPLMIAIEYVQIGDVEAGRVWLAHAKKQKGVKTTVLVDAAILLREKKYKEAASFFADNWRAIEGMLSAELMRPWRVRRAFAVQNAGGSADEVRELIAGAKPFAKGELEPLGVSWPEMHAFLVEHKLL